MSIASTYKRFFPLLFSHILGAFNDNLIKNVFVFLAAYKVTQGSVVWLLAAFFLYGVGFLGTSIYAGQFADKYPKNVVLKRMFLIQFGVVAFTFVGFELESRLIVLAALAMFGFCTSFIRAAKYSIVPELVSEKHLLTANALLKGFTFLTSAVAGVVLLVLIPMDVSLTTLGVVLAFSSLLAYLSATQIPSTPVGEEIDISRNPINFLVDGTAYVEGDHALRFYLASIAWYWFIGGIVVFFASDYVEEVLHAQGTILLFLTILFSVGYAAGSALCVYLNRRKWTFLVPLSALGISLFTWDLVWVSTLIQSTETLMNIPQFLGLGVQAWRVAVDVCLISIFGACFIIPFYARIQSEMPGRLLGRIFGYSTFICSLSVLAAVFIVLALKMLSFSILSILFALAIINLFFAVYTCQILPLKTKRWVFKKALRYLFKVEVHGMDNLKKAGPRVLIVTNHTSFLDALIISTFIDQKITFSLTTELSDKWWVRVLCSLMEIKPLDPVSPFAVKAMVEELRQDKLCMIFPEAQILDGNTRMKLYEGPALMAEKAAAKLLPIQLSGAEHTKFSRIKDKTYTQWFPKIHMNIMPAMDFATPKNMPFREARRLSSSKLYDLLAIMAFHAYDINQTLFQGLMKTYKAFGHNRYMLEDTERKPVKFKHIFLKSFILGGLINKAFPKEKVMGVMLPTSNACVFTVLGLHAYGKVPAMINFSSGPTQVVSTCRTAKVKTVLTAKKVVALAKLEGLVQAMEDAGVDVVYLEDMRKSLTLKDKLFGIAAMYFPEWAYKKTSHGASSKDTAAILFTSGSEGMPKGVLLSHENFLGNVYQVPTKYDILPKDVLMNCLPMFHSFGLMAGTFLPLILGVKAVLYPTPLHYRIIPELCSSTRSTIMFGTDTFLSGYAKCANPYDFNSLRICVAGAEKLKDETRQIWSEKFGVRVMEGYGATECAPVISVNTFLHNKNGSVGRLMTGMEYKLKPVPGIKEGQELVVRGPNIMQGYMKPDKPGVLQPPKDGWYETGDIVTVDEDGFVWIKGRSKRFAKIGGEMVSLLSVEQVIHDNWKDVVAGAVSVPDPKKGEQIVLITTSSDVTQDKLVAAFRAAGISELAIPKKIIVTDSPPLLGTGKFDYVSAKEMATKELG